MNHKWKYQPPTPETKEAAKTLAEEIGISPLLGLLLLRRGITTARDAHHFFHPQLSDLHDPFLMKDMAIAVERLNQAIGMKQKILICGDYDVDGCTAVNWLVPLRCRWQIQQGREQEKTMSNAKRYKRAVRLCF